MSSYGLEVLSDAECRTLLAGQDVGRVAVANGGPAILPVVYALLDGDVVFRTAPGEKLIAAALANDNVPGAALKTGGDTLTVRAA